LSKFEFKTAFNTKRERSKRLAKVDDFVEKVAPLAGKG
jgi:hypothetical protein